MHAALLVTAARWQAASTRRAAHPTRLPAINQTGLTELHLITSLRLTHAFYLWSMNALVAEF